MKVILQNIYLLINFEMIEQDHIFDFMVFFFLCKYVDPIGKKFQVKAEIYNDMFFQKAICEENSCNQFVIIYLLREKVVAIFHFKLALIKVLIRKQEI